MDAWFWVWFALAALLAAAEAVTGGFTVWPFAVGALCAAIADQLGASAGVQWIVLGVVSFVLSAVARRLASRAEHPQG